MGSRRWVADWWEVRPEAMGKVEIDPDNDLVNVMREFKTKAAAARCAKAALKNPRQAFGDACVTEQVVDWFVREDGVAEWADVGEPEYVA
jgi:hypothetical protein